MGLLFYSKAKLTECNLPARCVEQNAFYCHDDLPLMQSGERRWSKMLKERKEGRKNQRRSCVLMLTESKRNERQNTHARRRRWRRTKEIYVVRQSWPTSTRGDSLISWWHKEEELHMSNNTIHGSTLLLSNRFLKNEQHVWKKRSGTIILKWYF